MGRAVVSCGSLILEEASNVAVEGKPQEKLQAWEHVLFVELDIQRITYTDPINLEV